jgi:acetyl-CoA carboxylase biotin carboxylase subunit
MLGKLISWGPDRESARRRIIGALREMVVAGVRTNISFHRWVLNQPEFLSGDFDTNYVERVFQGMERKEDPAREEAALVAAVIAEYEQAQRLRPPLASDGGTNPWRLLGRPGAPARRM